MCGRYTLTTPGELIAEAFDLSSLPELSPRYNIAPTQEVAVIRRHGGTGARSLDFLRWGLIPFWAKDPTIGSRLINARSETVADKPSFRNAFKKRRCLVAADGYYEWKKEKEGPKQPYYIHLVGGQPFAFAGLWEHWEGEDGAIDSCTLLTIEPNELMAQIHNRMPVILHPGDYDLWLDSDIKEPVRLAPLLAPYEAEYMEACPVSRFVNSPSNDSPRCIEAVS